VIEVARQPFADLAEEAQRQVEGLARPPGGARHIALERNQPVGDLLGHGQGGKQAQAHGVFLADRIGRETAQGLKISGSVRLPQYSCGILAPPER
jgi:hypothetical protein